MSIPEAYRAPVVTFVVAGDTAPSLHDSVPSPLHRPGRSAA